MKADRYAATLGALTDALAFVADRMDVIDGSEGSGPRPNSAMTLQQALAPAVTDAYRLAKEHAEMLDALKRGHQKLRTYVHVYQDDKELRRLLVAWELAIAKAEAR